MASQDEAFKVDVGLVGVLCVPEDLGRDWSEFRVFLVDEVVVLGPATVTRWDGARESLNLKEFGKIKRSIDTCAGGYLCLLPFRSRQILFKRTNFIVLNIQSEVQRGGIEWNIGNLIGGFGAPYHWKA